MKRYKSLVLKPELCNEWIKENFCSNMTHERVIFREILKGTMMGGDFQPLMDMDKYMKNLHSRFHEIMLLKNEENNIRDDVRFKSLYYDYKALGRAIYFWMTRSEMPQASSLYDILRKPPHSSCYLYEILIKGVSSIYDSKGCCDSSIVSMLVSATMAYCIRMGFIEYGIKEHDCHRTPKTDCMSGIIKYVEFGIRLGIAGTNSDCSYDDMYYSNMMEVWAKNDYNIFNFTARCDMNIPCKIEDEKLEPPDPDNNLDTNTTRISDNAQLMDSLKHSTKEQIMSVNSSDLRALESVCEGACCSFTVPSVVLGKSLLCENIKMNKLNLYDYILDKNYSRYIIEHGDSEYMAIGDLNNDDVLYGIKLENTNDTNTYIKIEFNNPNKYKYVYDDVILSNIAK